MQADRLNLRHLRAALAVTRHGSISAAARSVNLTQPAITQGLAKLEVMLGERLFDRRSDGMAPTAAALLFARRVETALAGLDHRVTAAQLRAFLAVAKAGGYAAAAAATGLSDASLHRAVGDLALALGQTLVVRRDGGVALTARGRQVARQFSLARAELAAGLDELAAARGRETGRIAIGAMPLSRARLLPATLAAFHADHPEFSVVVAEGSHTELVGPLRDGDLDLLVGALREPGPGADLSQRRLFEDRPVVIGRADHPLAGRDPDLPTLARFPWTIAGRAAPLRDHWEQMFREAGLPVPAVPIECGSVITIRQLLMASDFLTLLSPDQVAIELQAGWLCVIRPAPASIVRTIGVTTRAGWTPTPLQAAFLTRMDAVAAETNP
ncbi:LysR family transcriptional regulator [Sphingomonas sp.]|jgi:DNA-binding transcriptional LysR family regulator|uniref:LysR family transcriptional regulator n=1 Tax=Sphingomonas sp. TaxID=28214 RepID=UPI002D7FF9C7|nr:LysR substrate-binding domain-containing protein [Sphingomonas sp.]HEU0045427.1 LysR substrate-binding domain-containing protein [Sphingomonas sp.]